MQKRWFKRTIAAALTIAMLMSQAVYASDIVNTLNDNDKPGAEKFIYPEKNEPVKLRMASQAPSEMRMPDVEEALLDPDVIQYGEPVAISEHAKVYQVGATSYKTIISEIPNTYTDTFGSQKAIDNTLTKKSQLLGDDYYTNAENDINVKLPVSMKKGQGVSFTHEGVNVELIPLNGDYTRSAVKENAILYNDVYEGIDVQYTAHEMGMKEDIILNRYVENNIFEYELVAKNVNTEVVDGKIYVHKLGAADPSMIIDAPIMADANGALCEVTLSLKNIFGVNVVTVEADKDWLSAPERAYPVRIDPNITVASSKIQVMTTASSRSNGKYAVAPYSYVGNTTGKNMGIPEADKLGKTRLYYKINENFPGLAKDAQITDAKFSVYQYTKYGANTFECYRLDGTWNIGSVDWSNSLFIPQTIAGKGAIALSGKGFHKFDITDTVKGWMSGSVANNGLMIKASNEDDGGGAFFTSASSSSQPGQNVFTKDKAPKIEISWDTAEPPADVELDDLTVNIRPMILKSKIGLLQNLGVFIDGVAAAESTVNWTLEGSTSQGEVRADKEYKYPDSTDFDSMFPIGTTKYKLTESNWQLKEPLTKLSFNTLYKFKASASMDGVDGTEVETDSFIYYKVQQNDLLPSIAKYYGVAIEEMMYDNQMIDMLLARGNTLFIRNPQKNADKPYTPSPLTIDEQRLFDSILLGRGLNCKFGFEPINLNTGNFYMGKTDVSIPDLGGDFAINRTYNSKGAEYNSVFGKGWQFDYAESLSRLEDGRMVYLRGDGSAVAFTPNGNGYDIPDGYGYTLEKKVLNTEEVDFGNGPESYDICEYILTSNDGTAKLFSQTGQMTEIKDSVGNKTTLSYDDSFNMTSITSPSGKTFGVTINENGQITSITLPNGGELRYEYDENENLISFTDAENRVIGYQYDDKNLMTSWTDANGNAVITNVYDDKARVVKQTDAEGNVSTLAYSNNQTTTTDAEGNVTVYNYDDNARTVKVTYPDGKTEEKEYNGNNVSVSTDKAGNKTTFEYDSEDRPIKETRFDNATRSYEYNSDGKVTKIIDYDGKITSYQYDASNNMIKQTNNDGSTMSYEYDSQNKVVKAVDQNGNTTSYEYDGAWVSTVTNAQGNKTKYFYNTHGQVVSVEDAIGGITRFTYDNTGRKLTEQMSDGTVTQFEYDPAGDVKAITDPRGLKTTFGYDKLGNMLNAVDPTGAITAMTYDKLYQKISDTDPDGRKTAYEYDQMGRIKSITDPDGKKTGFEFDALGNKIVTVEPKGAKTTAEYDLRFNAPAKVSNAQNAVTAIEYDLVGNMKKQTYADGSETIYTYDNMNRIQTVTDAAGLVTTYAYDKNGNIVKISDSLNRITSYEYNQLNNIAKITNPNGGATAFTYDALARLVETTDPLGAKTTFKYDAMGRVLQKTDALGQITSYEYDENGNAIKQIAQNGGVTTSQYDELDRLAVVTDPLQNQTVLKYDHTTNVKETQNALGYKWQYDFNGRALPTRMTDSMGNAYLMEYDDNGNNIKITAPNNASTVMEYDSLNRLAKETDGAGLITEYSYDSMNRVVETKDNASNKTTYIYDEAGRVKTSANALNQTTEYTYDVAGQVISVKTFDQNTVSYTYDSMGNVATITDPEGKVTGYSYDLNNNLIGSDDYNHRQWKYTYDELNRLTAAVNPLGKQTAYGFDEIGNITRMTDAKGNEETTAYDLVGNPLSKTDKNKNTYSFTYDELYRLINSKNPDGGVSSMLYDPLDRLTKHQDPLANITSYEYDNVSNMIKQTMPNNGVYEFEYDLHGIQTSQKDPLGNVTLSTVDLNGRTTEKKLPNTAKYSYAYDAIGRITKLTSPENMSKEFTYDEKGNLSEEKDQADRINSYSYDIMHRMTGMTNAKGNTTSYDYDTAGNLSSVVTPMGFKTSYEYDMLDRIEKSLDPVGRAQIYDYDVVGNLEKLKKRGGLAVSGEVSSNSRETNYGYDAVGNMISTTNPLSETSSYSYDSMNRLIGERFADNSTRSYTYDLNGQLLNMRDKNSGISAFSYDSMGNVTAIADAEKRKAEYSYDLINRMTKVVDGDNVQTNYSYDSVGNMTSRTNGEGKTTQYGYDLANRPTTVTNPLEETQQMRYNIQGNMSEYRNPDGTSIRYEYDKLDALVSKETDDTLANQSMFGYDADGRKISMDDVAGSTDYEYDEIGRITAVYLPMEVTAPQTNAAIATSAAVSIEAKPVETAVAEKFTERAKIAYEYDEWGNLASLVYPDHTTVEYQYDELDRLTKITDRRGNETSYQYDVSGNLTEVRRPNNTLSVMEYDVMGKITRLENRGEDISHSSFEYEYDLTGNIVSEITIQDDVTHTRTFTYDNRNQLTSTTDNNGYYTKYYTYEYDRNGNRIRAIESKGKNVTKDTKYYYDAADKMLKAADTVHWETRTTTYNYDKNGNLIQMNMPFGAVMTYDYNVENRLTAIHDKEHLLMAALYDGNGDRIFTVTNKEDTSGWHDDGNNGQWSTLKPGGDYDDGTWHPDVSSADDGSWKPDVSSNTSSKTSSSSTSSATSSENNGQWVPDVSSSTSSSNDGQWHPEQGGNGQWNDNGQWKPDTSNNWNDGQWHPEQSTRNALTTSEPNAKVKASNDGQWVPDTGNNGQWNPSGNNGQWVPDVSSSGMSSYDDGSWKPDVSSGDNGQWKPDVSSNTSSETTSSNVSSGTTSSEQTSSETPKDEDSGIPDVELEKGPWSNFDYDREMIRDTVLIPNGLNTWNEERYEMTGYINNINTANTQVLMEFHDKGYAGNIYEYGVKRESVSHWQNTNYYAYDGRGSVSDLVDPSGKVQMYHSYEPDGQTTLRFRGYIKNPYRYNAERVDYVPGIADFQYLRARYYAPNLGRFIQQDIVWGTTQTPLSQNLYAYCQNNAVNMIDPSGNIAISSILILAGLLISILAIPSSEQQPDYVGMSQDNVDMLSSFGTATNMGVFMPDPFAEQGKLMPNAEISLPGQASGKNYGSQSYPIYETQDTFGLNKVYKVTGCDGKTYEFIDYALAASYSSACGTLDNAYAYQQQFDANGKAIQLLGLDIALTGLSMRLSAPSGKVTVGGKSMPYDEWYQYMDDAMKQIDQDKIMLGKYDNRGPTSYITQAGSDHAYFDMGDNWNVLQSKYGFSNDDMFELFNAEFLDAGIDHMKQFNFSHNTSLDDMTSLGKEFRYLTNSEYPFINLP